MQTKFNALYLAARKRVRVTHNKRGWRAAHRDSKLVVTGCTRERALQACALAVAIKQSN